jgi:hypothetical protein
VRTARVATLVGLVLLASACTSQPTRSSVASLGGCVGAGEGPIAVLSLTEGLPTRTYTFLLGQQFETVGRIDATAGPAVSSSQRVARSASVYRAGGMQYTRFVTAGLGRSTVSLTGGGTARGAVVIVTCRPR